METTMVVPAFAGEGRLVFEERPVPRPQQPDDVLVSIHACGICGTDLNILAVPPAHKANPGTILGHESVGTVVETGPGVKSVAPGDRVVIAPRLTCGQCRYCRLGLDNQCEDYKTVGTTIDGAFAPYLRIPARGLYKIDAQVAEEDAVLFEPLSCVVGAVARAPIQPGAQVAIMVYRLQGAGKIIVADVVPYRLDYARRMGADCVLNAKEVSLPEAVMQETGIGCDLVVDAVGNQLGTAIRLARRGGQIVLFGLRPHENSTVNQYTITRYDLTVVGTYVGLKPFAQTVQLLESGILHPGRLITHTLPLAEVMHGVELMRSGQAMKVVIKSSQSPG
jgi:threonine dehydrogenase-like Zn-dependent dehydrogenase